MNHLRRSRVTKALADAGFVTSFTEAEARLDAVQVGVWLSTEQASTAAGQAAALTALTTAIKCFGRATLACPNNAALCAALPLGESLHAAAQALGATVSDQLDAATHVVQIGAGYSGPCRPAICWWDRWLAGTRRGAGVKPGDSRLAISGIFAGALAVRQVFAAIRTSSAFRPRDLTVSLWRPWTAPKLSEIGPEQFTAPDALWLVGLGHLGQAAIWNLLWLPYRAPRRAILQDDQKNGEENEATGLLVTGHGIGKRKTRVANAWLEFNGWETSLLERRHHGELRPTPDDPPFLVCGLDDVVPRRVLAGLGFDYMVDAGIGHGAGDFEGLQIRVIPKGASITGLWNAPEPQRSNEHLLDRQAYKAAEKELGACGTFMLADASVAVPFVGAATGALVVAQLIRLASQEAGCTLLQMELGAPDLVIDSGLNAPPGNFLGGEKIDLAAVCASNAAE